jgi:hypothetical protein
LYRSKKIFIILLYFIIIIYSVEFLLFFFQGSDQRSLINIQEKRLEIAKKNKIEFDVRSGLEVYISENKKNKDLYIPFYFNKSYVDFELVENSLQNNILIPFRGPINKQTLSCNEDLKFKIIKNDKYGFKNPNNVYEKKIEVFLVGDSYAEGLCENEKNDTSGHLRTLGFNSVNFGITGTGPLTSLAVIREYLEKFKPKHVVYLYFEGNDLRDLNWEKNTYLKKYLNKNFKLNYLNRQKDLEIFLENFQKKKISELIQHDISKLQYKSKNNFFSIFKDILEMTSIKGILRTTLSKKNNEIDLDLFF